MNIFKTRNYTMENTEKFEGKLTFDVQQGIFWIAQNDYYGVQLKFGDTFEVKVEDQWVETSMEIGSGESGELIFKLKNTPYWGQLDGLEARK